jgi:ParB family chromosome partitioning protein
MSKAPGLGRGLSALLGEQAQPPLQDVQARTGGVREIEIGRIRPNPNQPRVHFSDESIEELAESIAQRGVLQPILLRPEGDGFQIVAGERRWVLRSARGFTRYRRSSVTSTIRRRPN